MKNSFTLIYTLCLFMILSSCTKDEPENRAFDPTISMESNVNINTSEIGGSGLTLISYRDDDSPVLNNSFNTVVSKEGEQLLIIKDIDNELRALTLSTPLSSTPEIMQIDAQSTAIALVFISPGIITIEANEAKSTISNIKNLTSFNFFNDYLKNNLKNKSINDFSQEILYNSLLTDCVEEYFLKYKNLSKTSVKGIIEEKNRFSVSLLSNKRIELINSGWRFVDVVKRDINSTNNQLGSVTKIKSEMKGGTPLSLTSLFSSSVADPTKEIIDYSPLINTSYSEFWIVGPGLKKITDTPPQVIKDLDFSKSYFSTAMYYIVFPVLDLIAGGKKLTKIGSEEFKVFMLAFKEVKSLADIYDAAQKQDIKAYTKGWSDLAVTLVTATVAAYAVSAVGTVGGTCAAAASTIMVATSIFFGASNLFGFVYDEFRIEPYAKFTIGSYDGPPAQPILKTPANNSIDIGTPVLLFWHDTPNALKYELQISKLLDFSQLVFSQSEITSAGKQVTELLKSNKYYWRVRASNINGTSGWSEIWSFTTVAAANNPPATPSSSLPTNGATGISTSPTLSWSCTDPDGDPLTYDVYFGTANNPTTTIDTNQSLTSISRSGLITNTTYYWKVIAKDSKGASTSGPVWSFTTQGSSTGGIIFNPNLTYGSVTDVEGNVYKTIQIGTQLWTAENLKTTKYNDGSNIPLVTDNTTWGNLTTPAYCWYNNSSSTYKETYGAMYNWYVVNTGKICPTGWHVPSHSEWTTLTDYLGGESVAGGKIKETGTTHWRSPNTGATNSSGFTALPGGARNNVNSFGFNGDDGYWWASTEYSSAEANHRNTHYSATYVLKNPYTKKLGISVRCIKD